jgi:hypothetical protein
VGRTLELIVAMPELALPGDHLVHILGHVDDDGMFYVAPAGAPEFPPGGMTRLACYEAAVLACQRDGLPTQWMLLGPVDDLSDSGPLGGVRSAYWAAVLQGM